MPFITARLGLKRIANRIHRLTDILAAGLQQKGLKLRHAHYFDTLCVEVARQGGRTGACPKRLKSTCVAIS